VPYRWWATSTTGTRSPIRRGNGTRSAAVSVPAGSTLRFRYLAEGGVWFDDETAQGRDSLGAVITL